MAWYKDLFADEDPVRAHMYGESESSRALVDSIVEKLELAPGARILDLCCGQGRHSIHLARRGYDVVGVDLSDHQLGMCREAAAREGVEVRLVHCDAREIDFDSEFDAVLNLWTSFGYLESDAEDQKVLDAVYRALKPGGAFLIEMINAYSLIARHVPRDWMETAEGVHVLIDRHFDTATSRHCERQAAIYPDGRRREIDIVLRLYTCPELTRMLEAAGLRAEAVFGDDWSALLAESRRMAVLARR